MKAQNSKFQEFQKHLSAQQVLNNKSTLSLIGGQTSTEPEKADESREGISTLDLVLIS